MTNITPTKQALALAQELGKRGVKVELEHWDGHKHVDLFIPDAKLYIEIDGLQHYTDPNQLIETHLEEIAEVIAKISKD